MAGRTTPEGEGGKSVPTGRLHPASWAGETPSGSHNVAINKRWFCLAPQVTVMIHRVGCLPTSRRSPIRTWPVGL
jgi:hypothetical protein